MPSPKKSSTKKTKPIASRTSKSAKTKAKSPPKVKAVVKAGKKTQAKRVSTKSKSAGKPIKKPQWGIFGGSFDPFHNGHLNLLVTVKKTLGLERVIVIPTEQSPLRRPLQGAISKDRLEMVRLALGPLSAWVEISTLEIDRGGISYTIETLRTLQQQHPEVEWSIIMGMDQFERFGQWREYAEVLRSANLAVTSRPGSVLPEKLEDLPSEIRGFVGSVDKNKVKLSSGNRIQWVKLEDMDISATELRRKAREKEDISSWVPGQVAEYIRQNGLYQPVAKSIGDFESFTRDCAHFLASKGGLNLMAFDLRKESAPAEFTLIASGTSTRHAGALAEGLMREVKIRRHIYPQGMEGIKEGRWVVLDYGGLIVHIFYDFARQEYRLEDLWSKGVPMALEPSRIT